MVKNWFTGVSLLTALVSKTVFAASVELSISNISLENTLSAGNSYTATAQLRNNGERARDVEITYYLSTDNTVDNSDVAIGFDEDENFPGGSSYTEVTTLTIPASTTAGEYYVIASVRPSSDDSDTDWSNNRTSKKVSITSNKPDLYVVGNAPGEAFINTEVLLTAEVYNSGQQTSAWNRLGYYLSKKSSYDETAIYLGQDGVSGVSDDERIRVTIPGNLEAGKYFIIFYADDTHVIDEENEFNNTYVSEILIKSYPDLVASTIGWKNLSSQDNPGVVKTEQEIEISATVENIGRFGASQSVAKVYLSTSKSITNATLINSITVPALAINQKYRLPAKKYTIPKNSSLGKHQLIIRVDADQNIQELNEGNNFSYSDIEIKKDKPPKVEEKPTDLSYSELPKVFDSSNNEVMGDQLQLDATKPYKIKFKVKNFGTIDTKFSVSVSLFWDRDGELKKEEYFGSGSSFSIINDQFDNLEGKEELTINWTDIILNNQGIKNGSSYLFVLIDPYDKGAIKESNDVNNVYRIPIRVKKSTNQRAVHFGSHQGLPIDLGIYDGQALTISNNNTERGDRGFSNHYVGQGSQVSDDIFYRFDLLSPAKVNISTCGSAISDSYLHLLDQNGQHIVSNDDNGHCSNSRHSRISQTLQAGEYYVVTEGYQANEGEILLNIYGDSLSSTQAGANVSHPIDLGIVNNTAKTDSKINEAIFGNFFGQASNDIYYKFTIPVATTIEVSTCGSSISDSYIHLLNDNGELIAQNDDSSECSNGLHSYLKQPLQAGTYFIVTEGYSSNEGQIDLSVKRLR